MGGRGGASGRSAFGSPDGVFISPKATEVKTIYREARGFYGSYYKDEVLEAFTDGAGNVEFSYATGGKYEKTAKTNRTNYVTFNIKAGAVNGKTFNIDWSKVNSISGQTFKVKDEAKKAGLKWDGKRKIWTR